MLMRFNHPKAAIMAGVAASFIVTASPAIAQDSEVVVRGLPEGTKMELVSHRDLDLRYISQLNILNQRVGRAVRHVCQEHQPRDNMTPDYRDCVSAAWAGARPQMHRAYLHANRLASR
jgi:UrcA family protein